MLNLRQLSSVVLIALVFSACESIKVTEKSSLRKLASDKTSNTQAWVELGANGAIIARAITSDELCPNLRVDNDLVAMNLRIQSPEDMGNKVCELQISNTVKKLLIGEEELPLLKKIISKILVVGDTGCRIVKKKKSVAAQDCNNPKAWPFARLSNSAAKWQPDLVIHMGDYHYREAQCPEREMKCIGSTSGDNLKSWQEDFFTPARPLLQKAPWIFVRGNHELCARGGQGWFKYLDPRSPAGHCVDTSDPYWIKIGEHFIGVIDSADDKNIQRSLDSLKAPSEYLIWLVLHRPFLTLGADDETTTNSAQLSDNLKGKVSAVFTGHQHHLSLNRFTDSRPPELISGNGGTELEKPPKEIAPKDVYRTYPDFGFLTLEAFNNNSWLVTEHNVDGIEVIHCAITEKRGVKTTIDCQP